MCTALYNIWTSNSVSIENLADKFFDSRIDVLGLYLTEVYEDTATDTTYHICSSVDSKDGQRSYTFER